MVPLDLNYSCENINDNSFKPYGEAGEAIR
jgi:hypothetical protein